MNNILNKAKELWGSGASRSFKLSSWGVAIAIFSIYTFLSPDVQRISSKTLTQSEIDAHNKKIKGDIVKP